MKFVQDKSSGYRIQAYDKNSITLRIPAALARQNAHNDDTPGASQQQVEHSLILTNDQLISDWPPENLAELKLDHIQFILTLEPELVILGTGAKHQFPAANILQPFYQANIGCEVMDTAAACRTFNILVTEGRHVAVALMMIR